MDLDISDVAEALLYEDLRGLPPEVRFANTPSRKRKSLKYSCKNVERRPGKKGSKRYQRWSNLQQLFEVEKDMEFALPIANDSWFALLLENPDHLEVWTAFCQLSEAEQEQILQPVAPLRTPAPESEDSAAARFAQLNGRFRNTFQRPFPMDQLADMEAELRDVFGEDPQIVLIKEEANGFLRALLHALCQYYGLISSSETHNGVRRTLIENPQAAFALPDMPLADYLHVRRMASEPCC